MSSARIPSIRLVSATPSASGFTDPNSSSSFPNPNPNPSRFADSSTSSDWTTASPLAPRASPSRTRLVPKKSKLGLLGGRDNKDKNKDKDKGKDFSDVVRRVSGNNLHGSFNGSAKLRGGYEIRVDRTDTHGSYNRAYSIYVDPTNDPDLRKILMSQTQSTSTLKAKEATTSKEKTLKVKEAKEKENKDKWWTIGRGRKDLKDKKEKLKAPDPFKPITLSRSRFNSLDSGMLLGSSTSQPAMPVVSTTAFSTTRQTAMPMVSTTAYSTTSQTAMPTVSTSQTGLVAPPNTISNFTLQSETYSRSGTPTFGREPPATPTPTPTFGNFLAPPSALGPGVDNVESGQNLNLNQGSNQNQGSQNLNPNQGSIAPRAIRSVRLLAKIGGWNAMNIRVAYRVCRSGRRWKRCPTCQTMSMSVDDTFFSLGHAQPHKKRVDNDASRFFNQLGLLGHCYTASRDSTLQLFQLLPVFTFMAFVATLDSIHSVYLFKDSLACFFRDRAILVIIRLGCLQSRSQSVAMYSACIVPYVPTLICMQIISN
ncbi:hypothetical protein C8J56DRAFT_1027159 [Mycena floridula]|nr:hypothetical protein C8J56DRAFT_1027159 [Mycena floridula]